MRFPRVSGENLLGQRFALPGDLAGEFNVLLVPYEMWQQSEVDTWVAPLDVLARRLPTLRAYELPTLPRYNALARRSIDAAMRYGIPDAAVRARTITLYVDRPAFRAALGLANEDHTAILLVRRDGTVLWRAEGPWSEEQQQGLETALGLA